MTYRQLRRKLESLGCMFERQGSGSHEIWLNPANGRRTTVPRHGDRDLATGTLLRLGGIWESPGLPSTQRSPARLQGSPNSRGVMNPNIGP